ncbi:carbohydrate-binding protein [Niastella yeongjuensis]|uniref:Carbohydrate-binding protein n=1 Tax=Niastella yeongjuensis TaxID=354355 RepID=A0A1V9F7M0_9BACT|nr:carbohydrate-binding protein [Niastella yeongjuensis]OQP54272.1 carbohydrate-binding protein [Niastella yeongjuensis]SEP31011.1 Por secretion system C-terminal sorting domain-containing protein [Niastella yeongjuensis]
MKIYKLRKQLVLSMSILMLLLSTVFSATAQTPKFKVVAFYNGTWDAAHINFVKEANPWFTNLAAQYGFSYTATNNWDNLNANFLKNYQVVLFLDDAPTGAAQRAAFQQYMENGGRWMGFHVSAWTDNAGSWSWYYNTFLGSGNFRDNTWEPTKATLKCEDRTHPSTLRLPTTFTSSVSEWYSWTNDLRNNSNIKVLCSVDPSSFPLGTTQKWTSGYYPIVWTNKNYKMVYANFGHNAMNYSTNVGLSSTFGSETQNKFIIDAIMWLGGQPSGPAPAVSIPGTVQAENYTNMSGIQTETTTDAGGGSNVGYIDAGDWMDYKVNVQTAGTYTVQYRVASEAGGGSIQLKKDSTVILATTVVPATGAWQTWTTITDSVVLAAGEQTLRIQAPVGGYNLNWFSLATSTPNNPGNTAPIGQVITLRGNNGFYVSGENGTKAMTCTRTAPQTWEQFTVLDAGNGKVNLRSMGQYVSSENGTKAMTANRPAPQGWEAFDWIVNADGSISLRGNNGFFVSSENGEEAMTCTRPTADAWEKFNFSIVSTARMAAVQNLVTGMSPSVKDAYPNPFTTQLHYTVPEKYASHTVTVYDFSGKQILHYNVNNRQGNYTLDGSTLPTGMYILDISSGDFHKRVKVQKKK